MIHLMSHAQYTWSSLSSPVCQTVYACKNISYHILSTNENGKIKIHATKYAKLVSYNICLLRTDIELLVLEVPSVLPLIKMQSASEVNHELTCLTAGGRARARRRQNIYQSVVLWRCTGWTPTQSWARTAPSTPSASHPQVSTD